MFQPNLKFVASSVPKIITIGVLGGLRTPNLGEEEAVRVGERTFERALVSSYRLHSKCSSIFTRFRDISAFVLQHAIFSHPTSNLPQISPCFTGILGIGEMPLGYEDVEERRCSANIVLAISFQDFQSM